MDKKFELAFRAFAFVIFFGIVAAGIIYLAFNWQFILLYLVIGLIWAISTYYEVGNMAKFAEKLPNLRLPFKIVKRTEENNFIE